MIVHDLDFYSSFLRPDKAQAPLTVDADAVLAFAIVFKSLETVPWRHLQVIENCGPIQLCELAKCRALNVDPALNATAFKQGLRVLALEALDRHRWILTRRVYSVKHWSRHTVCLCGLTFELSRTRRNDARARQKENVPTLLAGPGGMPLGLGLNEGLGISVCHERTMDEKGGYSSVRCFAKDGGRPSGVGLQEQAPNRHELLG